jgi:hypothetical protein
MIYQNIVKFYFIDFQKLHVSTCIRSSSGPPTYINPEFEDDLT